MKVGDLVRILRYGTLGIVVDFDGDGNPMVRYIAGALCGAHPYRYPPVSEYVYDVEVLSECR